MKQRIQTILLAFTPVLFVLVLGATVTQLTPTNLKDLPAATAVSADKVVGVVGTASKLFTVSALPSAFGGVSVYHLTVVTNGTDTATLNITNGIIGGITAP